MKRIRTAQLRPPQLRSAQLRPRRRGFTLLELILALTLVALVALTLFGSLRVAIKGKEAAETNVEPIRTADLAFEIMRRDFECATPPTGILSQAFSGTNNTAGDGESDSILFFTTAPGPQHIAGDGDIRRIEYAILEPDDTHAERVLVRRVAHNLLAPQQPQFYDDEILIRGIAGFTIVYYDGVTTDPYPSWDSTQYNNQMPPIVEITIELDRPVGVDGVMKRFPFTRRFQIPCGVVQQSTTTGLGL